MADVAIVASEVASAPQDYTLPGAQEILLRAVGCTVNGTNASGEFLPALQMLDPAGHVMWTAVNRSVPIAAGRSALFSWFPGGGVDQASTNSSSAAAGIASIASPTGTLTVTNPTGPSVGVDMPVTGVSAGSYGDATHVSSITVDAEGRLTAASSTAISGISGTGLSLIFDSTLRADTASIDTGANAIANTHIGLIIYIYVRTSRAAVNDNVGLQFNGDTGANYDYQQFVAANTGVTAGVGTAFNEIFATIPSNTATANAFGLVRCDVFNYAGTTGYKTALLNSANAQTTGANDTTEQFAWEWRNTGAINQVTVFSVTGSNLKAGTRVTILGVQ